MSHVLIRRTLPRAFDDGFLISTDPPYYDNIGYSDLSDYFYVWLRRSFAQSIRLSLSTMLVPKAEELVANPYRHGGKTGAQKFFEEGFAKYSSKLGRRRCPTSQSPSITPSSNPRPSRGMKPQPAGKPSSRG